MHITLREGDGNAVIIQSIVYQMHTAEEKRVERVVMDEQTIRDANNTVNLGRESAKRLNEARMTFHLHVEVADDAVERPTVLSELVVFLRDPLQGIAHVEGEALLLRIQRQRKLVAFLHHVNHLLALFLIVFGESLAVLVDLLVIDVQLVAQHTERTVKVFAVGDSVDGRCSEQQDGKEENAFVFHWELLGYFFDETQEQGVRMQDGAGVFGMELGADKPTVAGDLYNLDQVTLGIHADALHAVFLVFVFIKVVELVSVAMAFADLWCAIDLGHTTAFSQVAAVSTQTHGAAQVGNGLLLLHHVDDIVRSIDHLTRVGVFVTQHVAGKFDDHHLHAEAYTEGRQVVDTRILHSDNLAFDATLSEARAYQDACHA